MLDPVLPQGGPQSQSTCKHRRQLLCSQAELKLAVLWFIYSFKQVNHHMHYLRLVISQGHSRFWKQPKHLDCWQQWFLSQISPDIMGHRKLFNVDCVLYTLKTSTTKFINTFPTSLSTPIHKFLSFL